MKKNINSKEDLIAHINLIESRLNEYNSSRKGAVKEFSFFKGVSGSSYPAGFCKESNALHVVVQSGQLSYAIKDSDIDDEEIQLGTIEQAELPEFDFNNDDHLLKMEIFSPKILNIIAERGQASLSRNNFVVKCDNCVSLLCALICCSPCLIGTLLFNIFTPNTYRKNVISNQKMGIANVGLLKLAKLKNEIRSQESLSQTDIVNYRVKINKVVDELSDKNDELHNKYGKNHLSSEKARLVGSSGTFFQSKLTKICEKVRISDSAPNPK